MPDRIARLEIALDAAIAHHARVEAVLPYNFDATSDSYVLMTEAYAKLGAAQTSTEALEAGWENGPASCQRAMAAELRIRYNEER